MDYCSGRTGQLLISGFKERTPLQGQLGLSNTNSRMHTAKHLHHTGCIPQLDAPMAFCPFIPHQQPLSVQRPNTQLNTKNGATGNQTISPAKPVGSTRLATALLNLKLFHIELRALKIGICRIRYSSDYCLSNHHPSKNL